ncbi:MAG: PAS domain-containing protein [Candidatus Thermoplasmatota archaeon]|nr:PAS domain-containing protein [Candidatus Thermoplasmatota archaeon]
MKQYQKEIKRIQQALKENPKGMTVTDIARCIKINRNSVAKYLDIMRISGVVEMITFGPAKVFFPARRIPVTELLHYTSDYILVFDDDLKITFANETFLRFLDEKTEDIIGHRLDALSFDFIDNTLSLALNEALEGKGGIQESTFSEKSQGLHLKIKVIPTTFESGGNGVTLIMKNITHQRRVQELLQDWAKPQLKKTNHLR